MNLKLEWPQLIYLALLMIGVGVNIAKFGEAKEGTYGLGDIFLGSAIGLPLLWWGGFFG